MRPLGMAGRDLRKTPGQPPPSARLSHRGAVSDPDEIIQGLTLQTSIRFVGAESVRSAPKAADNQGVTRSPLRALSSGGDAARPTAALLPRGRHRAPEPSLVPEVADTVVLRADSLWYGRHAEEQLDAPAAWPAGLPIPRPALARPPSVPLDPSGTESVEGGATVHAHPPMPSVGAAPVDPDPTTDHSLVRTARTRRERLLRWLAGLPASGSSGG